MADQRQDHAGGFWFGFFLGGLIGGVLIFFLGTKEGKKASKILEKKSKDALGDLENKLEELEEKGKDVVEHGRRLFKNLPKKA